MKRTILTSLCALALILCLAPTADAAIINVTCTNTPFAPANIVGNPGDVFLVSGTCSAGFVVSNQSDLLIVGADFTTGLTGAYPAGLGTPTPPNALIYDNNSTCATIRDSRNITVVGFIFEYCAGNGITVQGSNDIHLGGNAFYGSDQHGIEVVQSHRVEIFGNYIYNASNGGFAGIFVDPASRYAQIHDNRVAKNDRGIVVESGRATLTLNEVFGNISSGIDVTSILTTVSRNTVTNNGPSGSPQISYVPQVILLETCVVGNHTGMGVLGVTPQLGGCASDNT